MTMPVIDYDHQTDIGVPKGGTAPAAGWITAFQAREDGIWARVEWTGKARAAIAANHAGFGAVDPALYVPRDVFETTAVKLNSVKAQRLEEHALVKVTAAMQSGKVSTTMRDWALALCRSNPGSFDEFVSRVPPIIAPGSQFDAVAGNVAAVGRGRSALSADQLAVCAALDLDPQDYARSI